MKKWEYTVKYFFKTMPKAIDFNIVNFLEKLGEEGWELVWVDREEDGDMWFYFKREKNSE